MILEVLETLNMQEQEIQTQAGYWYSLRIRPYRTTENQIDGVTLVFIDIDTLKRHAAILEAARNYAEMIVETVQTPLIVLDADLRINTANRAFYEMFQVSSSQTSQSSLFEPSNSPWNIPQLRSSLADLLAHRYPIQRLEVEYQSEQIGRKTLLINACELRQDNSLMILLSIEDITERKQFETERLARQQAEAANQAKEDFLSNLSHELRNPLNTILGWSKLLRGRTLTEAAVARALEAVERSAIAQAQLIEDMLDVSRITSGKLRLNKRLIDLSTVMSSALDTIQLSADAKNIQLVSKLTTVIVMGDVDRLQQVFWNLLSNAVKFTPTGGQVSITLSSVDTRAQVIVRDNGQGIRADLLPYIFDRFRQGDSSTTKSVSGLGLGLAIVRHLIELHGGTVQAESLGEGQGTTMTVWLPLSRSTLPDLAPSAIAASDQAPSLAGLQILAVDDQVDTRELLKFVLESCGASVLTVANAKDALSALSASPNRYDLLLSDIGMPEENGCALIQQVRSLGAEAGGQIPAIALTAYAGGADRERAIKAGFQAHVVKPIEPLQLAWIIANLIQGR